jgi:hypothetical protein
MVHIKSDSSNILTFSNFFSIDINMSKIAVVGIIIVVILVAVGIRISMEKSDKKTLIVNLYDQDPSFFRPEQSGKNTQTVPNGVTQPTQTQPSGIPPHPSEPKPAASEPPKPVANNVRRDELLTSLMVTSNPNNPSLPWILREDELPLMGKGRRYMHALNPNYWKYIKHVEPNWNIEHIYIVVPCSTGICTEAVADYILDAMQNPATSSILVHTKNGRYNINAWQNICSDTTGKSEVSRSYDRTYYVTNKNKGKDANAPDFLLYNWNDPAFVRKMAAINVYPPKDASGNCSAYSSTL